MKLTYTLEQCANYMGISLNRNNSEIIEVVYYDSRKIISGQNGLFFCLNGPQRNGSTFALDAYNKGVRNFVVQHDQALNLPTDAQLLYHENPLFALQQLAKEHRKKFNIPVVAITGSVGKTTFKEWLYHVLSPSFRIARSPKSFNSQLGVALSLFELNDEVEIALIEAGISHPNEMETLVEMIQPTHGVFTAFGSAHRINFEHEAAHLNEKLKLFKNTTLTFVAHSIEIEKKQLEEIHGKYVEPFSNHPTHNGPGLLQLLGLVKEVALHFQLTEEQIKHRTLNLPSLAMRLEVFDGIHQNTILNDTYNLDFDALKEALHTQQRMANSKKRVVIIGLNKEVESIQPQLNDLVTSFEVDQIIFIRSGEAIDWSTITNSIVLIKTPHNSNFESIVEMARKNTHRTWVEIRLNAIRHNLNYIKTLVAPTTELLCMVKASSYGSGAERVAQFLQHEGIHYFGVAFVDEGVALRKAGIELPILVMNPDMSYATTIIDYGLEPAVYSMNQLEEFTQLLIRKKAFNYPIHLKFDTGMHRLGFATTEKQGILEYVLAQPELYVKGIYSHLADADNENTAFTQYQTETFKEIVLFFRNHLAQPFKAHLLNSEGIFQHTDAQFDMVRIGIALYGYPSHSTVRAHLQDAVRWYSALSQVKTIEKGEHVGYGCSYTANEPTKIGIVPVGYADGLRRSLSNGKGKLFVNGVECPILGRVCMDMVIIDLNGTNAQENDLVELIGEHQTMEQLAQQMETIPYEVMTSMSQRMHRIYTED